MLLVTLYLFSVIPDILLLLVVVVLGRFPGSTSKAPLISLLASPTARSPSDNDEEEEEEEDFYIRA
jgi:hypothetical protein